MYMYKKLGEVEQNKDVVKQAMDRVNLESIPFWSQDLGFKLIKMNEINAACWKVKNIKQKLY